MKKISAILVAFSILFSCCTHAASFEFIRWQEGYRYLQNKKNPNSYEKLKYQSLGNDQYVSFGGTVRQRLNNYDNDLFTLAGERNGAYALNRLLVHTDLHLNNDVRVFFELGHHYAAGSENLHGPFDEDKLDITQGFVDLTIANTQLRIGRQEMMLGSARLLGVRDGPNIRLSFDGIRLDKQLPNAQLKIFSMRPITITNSQFDNTTKGGEAFWGGYSTWQLPTTKADLYYLGVYRRHARFAQGIAKEKRHTIGARFFGQQSGWDWNYELAYQFGDFGRANIHAWTAASITGYTFKTLRWQPRFSISANIASGDRDSNDNALNTFNPLYPNLAYFEEAAVLAPQNFFNIEPEIKIKPTNNLTIAFDWNFFWQLEKNDAVYVRGLNPIDATTHRGGSRRVAHVPSLNIDYQYNQHLMMDISYSHFFAGNVITASGGEDIRYFKLQASWTF